MPVIVVANPGRGVGKSTLSTNLAGYLASRGHAVMPATSIASSPAFTWLVAAPAAAAGHRHLGHAR